MANLQFTWWPWRTLALALPALAGASAWAAASQGRKPIECITVFFLVIAAGNAYLFAMVIGDFGRSLIAIPVGAASAMLGVTIFVYPIANAIFVAILGVLFLILTYRRGIGILFGLCGAILMFLLVLSFSSLGKNPEWELAVVCTYPFICGCVTGSMPLDSKAGSILAAIIAGILASVRGMMLGVPAAMALMMAWVFCMIPLNFFAGGVRWVALAGPIAAVGAVLCVNYVTVQFVFDSIYRVESSTLEAGEGVSEIQQPAENS